MTIICVSRLLDLRFWRELWSWRELFGGVLVKFLSRHQHYYKKSIYVEIQSMWESAFFVQKPTQTQWHQYRAGLFLHQDDLNGDFFAGSKSPFLPSLKAIMVEKLRVGRRFYVVFLCSFFFFSMLLFHMCVMFHLSIMSGCVLSVVDKEEVEGGGEGDKKKRSSMVIFFSRAECLDLIAGCRGRRAADATLQLHMLTEKMKSDGCPGWVV